MKHIILIGFKHVGKSAIAAGLAEFLERQHIDLDDAIINVHTQKTGEHIACGEIVRNHGEAHFRELEHAALRQLLEESDEPAVISLGGGAPLSEVNQRLLFDQQVIHVTAPKGGIYERIVMNGRPAFFPTDEDPFLFFQKLWEEREPVYQQLANHTIENTGSVKEAVRKIKNLLVVPV